MHVITEFCRMRIKNISDSYDSGFLTQDEAVNLLRKEHETYLLAFDYVTQAEKYAKEKKE